MEHEPKLSIPGFESAVKPRERLAALRSYFENRLDSEVASDALTRNDVTLFDELVDHARKIGPSPETDEGRVLRGEITRIESALKESPRTREHTGDRD